MLATRRQSKIAKAHPTPLTEISRAVAPRVRDVGTTSLMRAFSILELVAHKSGGLTNAEISRRLKIATSTSSYILSRLEREGYLRRNPEGGRYEIGLKVIALAHGALRDTGLRKAAEPVLHWLAAETHYSALVGVLERGLMMIVDKVEQPGLARIDMDIGVRYPAHTTALGKVLLAHMPEADVTALFERRGMPRTTEKSIASTGDLFQELTLVRERGYAMSNSELFMGISAVAAPIFDGDGRVCAAVSATGGSCLTEDSKLSACVTKAGREISSRMAAAETGKHPRV